MSDSRYILLVLSVTEIVFGCLSIVGNFCRILVGALITGTRIGVPIFDLILGLCLLIIGSYGVSVARKIRSGRTSFKSLPIIDLLNILMCVIYSVYLLAMLLVATLITTWVTHHLGLSAVKNMGILTPDDHSMRLTFHMEGADTELPASESMQFAAIVLVILAEMVVTALAAKMSRNIAAGRGVGTAAPAATCPSRSSVYAHQPLLMVSEKI